MRSSDSYPQSRISEIEDMVNQEIHTWNTQNVDPLPLLFQNFELIHNGRSIMKITISHEGDGAAVDIDTL